MKTQNMQLITNENAQTFYDEVRHAIKVMEDERKLETEVKFSTAVQRSGNVLYSALVIGRSLWVN